MYRLFAQNECSLSGVDNHRCDGDTQTLLTGKKVLCALSGGGDANFFSIPSAIVPYEPPGETFTT